MRFNFTDQVYRVLERAPKESARLGHDYVGTEHILLAALEDRDVQRMIGDLGQNPERVRSTLEAAVRPGGASPAPGTYPYSSRAKKTLEFAMSAARELKSSLVAPEHLILGLLREERGIASEVLRKLDITPERIRHRATEGPPSRTTQFSVSIDDSSDQSIYEQIVAQVTEAVATGELRPGERLPTVRQLADVLDIAPGTVARAYSELESHGLVVTEGTKGTRIAEREPPTERTQVQRSTLIGLLRPIAVAAFHLGASASQLRSALDEAMRGIFDKDNRAA